MIAEYEISTAGCTDAEFFTYVGYRFEVAAKSAKSQSVSPNLVLSELLGRLKPHSASN